MAVRRRTILVADHEEKLLKEMYLARKIPIDQYDECPRELHELVDSWNGATGRSDSSEEIMRLMRTRRKTGKWVTFSGDHKPRQKTSMEFTPEQTEALIQIFQTEVAIFGNGSDSLSYDAEVRRLIAKEFAMRTGRRILRLLWLQSLPI